MPSPYRRRGWALPCWVLCLALFAPGPVAAQTTAFRCEAGGRTTYQSSPCALGTPLNVDDHRSTAQSEAARAEVQREGRFADQLAAANLQRAKTQEALAAKQLALARAPVGKAAVTPKRTPTSKPRRLRVAKRLSVTTPASTPVH